MPGCDLSRRTGRVASSTWQTRRFRQVPRKPDALHPGRANRARFHGPAIQSCQGRLAGLRQGPAEAVLEHCALRRSQDATTRGQFAASSSRGLPAGHIFRTGAPGGSRHRSPRQLLPLSLAQAWACSQRLRSSSKCVAASRRMCFTSLRLASPGRTASVRSAFATSLSFLRSCTITSVSA